MYHARARFDASGIDDRQHIRISYRTDGADHGGRVCSTVWNQDGDQAAGNCRKRHKSRVSAFFCFALIFARQHHKTPSESLKSGKFGIFLNIPYIAFQKWAVPGGGGHHGRQRIPISFSNGDGSAYGTVRPPGR